jgi:uncharacterized protein involved in exopolysaccharide biosynthesis
MPDRIEQAAYPVEERSFLALVNAVLRRRHWVFRGALGAILLVLGILLVTPRSWSTEAALVPSVRSASSALSGLAAQFGVIAPGADPSQSPQFYADFVQSPTLLGAVVDQKYSGVDLATRWGMRAARAAKRRDLAIRKLARSISASVAPKTGVLRIRVVTSDPDLSFQLITAVLDQLNKFNLETRQSRAGAERRFTQERLAQARVALDSAEDRLQRFVVTNRDVKSSSLPELEQQRLSRDVALKQQIFSQLSLSFEQARIEEVRDTPLLSVTEPPQIPFEADSSHLIRNGIAALLLGAFGGILLALLAGTFDLTDDRTNERDDFRRFTASLVHDMFSPRLWAAPRE